MRAAGMTHPKPHRAVHGCGLHEQPGPGGRGHAPPHHHPPCCARLQGCMNNLTLGDEGMGYYETIAGGAGAGPGWHGRSGVHTHMTNTRITGGQLPARRGVGAVAAPAESFAPPAPPPVTTPRPCNVSFLFLLPVLRPAPSPPPIPSHRPPAAPSPQTRRSLSGAIQWPSTSSACAPAAAARGSGAGVMAWYER